VEHRLFAFRFCGAVCAVLPADAEFCPSMSWSITHQPVAGANRLWRFCFPTSRDSRHESAVAQLFLLGALRAW
jgi:hypothetical protein